MARYTLREPFEISSRLMPAIKIAGATLSIDYYGTWTREGRMQWDVWIDLPDGSEYQITDMRSGVGGSPLIEAFRSLLSFLSAAAESRNYRERTGREGENEDLFAGPIVDWASANSDEISMVECEIEGEAGELALQEA